VTNEITVRAVEPLDAIARWKEEGFDLEIDDKYWTSWNDR
jgi:hypothetical protein